MTITKTEGFKQTEIGEIPADWEIKKLGDVAKTTSGGTPSRSRTDFYNGAIPWVKSGELEDTVILETEERISEIGLNNSAAKIFPEGTLLIALYGATVGRTAILGISASTNQAICAIFPDEKVLSGHYLKYFLIQNRPSLLKERYGGAQPNISQQVLQRLSVIIPPKPEQEKIAFVLSEIQKAVETQGKIIANLKELKAATMAKLFHEGIIAGFMFDSNIFDKIVDGKTSIDKIQGHRLFITHIQRNELEKTKDLERRKALLSVFEATQQNKIPTKSAVWGVSNWGEACWPDENDTTLEKLTKDNPKNTEDALIAETCIKNLIVLVTDDIKLQKRVMEQHGEAISFDDFVARRYRKFKQTEIGEIPQSWEIFQLGDIVTFKNGINFSSNQKGQGVLTVDVLNMYSENLYVNPKDLYRVNIELTDEYCLKPNDLLFVRSSLKQEGVGWPALFLGHTEPVTFCGFIIRARLTTEQIAPAFLTYYLRLPTLRTLLISRSDKVAITNVSQGNLKILPIVVPSLAEQNEITSVLLKIDEKIRLAQIRASIAKEFFSSMLHQLITGKKRLKYLNVEEMLANVS